MATAQKNYWLSFCDDDRPHGHQFLGVIVTQSGSAIDAIQKTHSMGINPGGCVWIYETDAAGMPAALFDRLLSRQELCDAGVTTFRRSDMLHDQTGVS